MPRKAHMSTFPILGWTNTTILLRPISNIIMCTDRWIQNNSFQLVLKQATKQALCHNEPSPIQPTSIKQRTVYLGMLTVVVQRLGGGGGRDRPYGAPSRFCRYLESGNSGSNNLFYIVVCCIDRTVGSTACFSWQKPSTRRGGEVLIATFSFPR